MERIFFDHEKDGVVACKFSQLINCCRKETIVQKSLNHWAIASICVKINGKNHRGFELGNSLMFV